MQKRAWFYIAIGVFMTVWPVFGAQQAQQIARISVLATSVEWQPLVPNEGTILTINGPGDFTMTRVFEAGRAPSFKLADIDSGEVDGSYVYELRAIPRVTAATRAAIAQARAHNDEKQIKAVQRAAGLNEPLVQSGALAIVSGNFVSTTLEETPGKASSVVRLAQPSSSASGHALPPAQTLDQVVPDDMIVQGSLCVGLDCVNNESFGFDTIRLKENNTRIAFSDTSTTTGFPANLWQLTANDNASGGLNKFSIDDITGAKTPFTVLAGAPTNSIFVASSGKVGFRTATPVLDLHMVTTDTPAIRFEQTNGGGFTAQTWDVAGNEANFFIRDTTGGSRLPFRVRPGAPTSSIDIAANGYVGIGTASPTQKLHVYSDATADSVVSLGFSALSGPALNIGYGGASLGRSAAFINVRPDASAVGPNPSLRLMTANAMALVIDNQQYIGLGGVTDPTAPIEHISGAKLTAAGVWQSVSSRAAKMDIHAMDAAEAVEALRELEPVHFEYKAQPDDPQVGFIAEDVPEIVATPDRKTLNPLEIVAVLAKVVKEQQKTIEALSKRVGQLEDGR